MDMDWDIEELEQEPVNTKDRVLGQGIPLTSFSTRFILSYKTWKTGSSDDNTPRGSLMLRTDFGSVTVASKNGTLWNMTMTDVTLSGERLGITRTKNVDGTPASRMTGFTKTFIDFLLRTFLSARKMERQASGTGLVTGGRWETLVDIRSMTPKLYIKATMKPVWPVKPGKTEPSENASSGGVSQKQKPEIHTSVIKVNKLIKGVKTVEIDFFESPETVFSSHGGEMLEKMVRESVI